MIRQATQTNTISTQQGFDLSTCFNQAAVSGYVKDPDYYFDSYAHFTIHEDMLKDNIRTKSYRDAIMNCREHFEGKIVLDIGSGTGILSMFAGKLRLVPNTSMQLKSRKIIKQNGLEGKITVINGKVEEVELPVQKVDTIISEWMGYFLIYESMLDTVLFARDKWLAPGGIVLPDKASMFIAGIEDEQYYYNRASFWDEAYGFNMKSLKPQALKSPLIYPADQEFIVTNSFRFKDFDLLTVKVSQLDFSAKFSLEATTPSIMHGLAAWFTVDFSRSFKENHKDSSKKDKQSIVLSTSPFTKFTHWKHTLFYLQMPMAIGYKQRINGQIDVSKAQLNHRQIDVGITLNSINYKHNQKYRIN